MIDDFSEEYRFLSNFHPSTVLLDGIAYPTVENAYQAAKTLKLDERKKFINVSPSVAKQFGKNRLITPLRPDWENVKISVMKDLLVQKFSEAVLMKKLKATKPHQLVEGNYWHDNIWGVCYCKYCPGRGKNLLGKLLEQIRDC